MHFRDKNTSLFENGVNSPTLNLGQCYLPLAEGPNFSVLTPSLSRTLFANQNTRTPQSSHRIDTQPEVQLRVGAFDVGVLVFSAAALFLASVHGKCLRYTEDVDVVFTKKNSSLFTLERGQ